ncbi:metallophosphoesterase family protein [Candidatus Berkelbacteria bacterium]|nr:metallophosphoesterase family protein [Candidatus Berkelbacteria bacterium]
MASTLVGICADLHDNLANFDALLTRQSELHELWIAGDCGTPETVATVCQRFINPIRLVAGNVEQGHRPDQYAALTERFPHLRWQAEAPLLFPINARWQGQLVHHPFPADQASRLPLPTIIVTGHTHRPHLARHGQNWLINPGTLGGVFTPATYAIATFSPDPHFVLHRLY